MSICYDNEDDGLDALCEALEVEQNELVEERGGMDSVDCQDGEHHSPDVLVSENDKVVSRRVNDAPMSQNIHGGGSGSGNNVHALGDLVYSQHVSRQQLTYSRKQTAAGRARTLQDVGQGALVSKYSGLRISKALISSAQLQSTLEGLSFIKIDQMRQRIIQDTVPKRWCTIGVVGEVSTPRTAQHAKGGQYCIWKLTDLKETMMMVYVFGNAYHDYRDEVKPGTLVCLVAAKTRKSADAVTLSIDAYSQLLICGDSLDFAYCSGKRKDGQPCRIPVNKSTCEYCSYHVGAAYKQISSLRRELQGGSLGSAFQKGKSKLKWTVGSFEKKQANGMVQRAAKKEDLKQVAEKSLGKSGSMGSKYLVTCADPVKALHLVKEEDARKKRMISQKGSTRMFDSAPIPDKHLPAVVVQHGQLQDKQEGRKVSSSHAKLPATSLAGKNLSGSTAKQRGSGDGFVQLHDDDPISSYALDLTSGLPNARAQAASILKKKRQESKGSVDAPSFLTKSLEAHGKKADRKPPVARVTKAHVPQKQHTVKGSVRNSTPTMPAEVKPNSFASLFGDVIKEMEINTRGNPVQSRYKHVVEAADDQALMDTLDVLEKKDTMAEKMDSVKSLKVSAFKCAVCAVIMEKRHDTCLKKHPEALSRIDTMKRWWKCSDCKKVFATLGVNYPTGACIKCDSNQATFEKHSMYQPMSKTKEAMLTDGVACKENMLPRGREQKWVNQ